MTGRELKEHRDCHVKFTQAADAEAVGAGPRPSAAPGSAVVRGVADPRRARRLIGGTLAGLDLCEDEEHCRDEGM